VPIDLQIVMTHETSAFQQAIETVEALPLEDQAVLVDIIQQRLKQQRREELLQRVAETEQDYAAGNIRRGAVADLMAELDD
jgi:hypothetical protein